MPGYVVFLRAVNVSPRWVKMARLREVLTAEGFGDVETYIQSGNVRVTSSLRSARKVSRHLEDVLETAFGFTIPCIVRTTAELADVASYADSLADPLDGATQRRYVTFFAAPVPKDRAEELTAWNVRGERLQANGSEIYWWLDKSTHEARMSNAVLERGGLVATTRDLKVVRALAERWS
ncbi:DUF1697 domain-containing protein [Flexivirga meconopsidis]|uniref:DUF1697 domain-containing protein n=1 Tax=Flexivirga meconopsidis TaxID=2977121 RepID=UPI002240ABFA